MSDLSQNEVAVFNAARRLAGHERTAYLDAACAGNAAMRHRLDELLRVDEAAGDFLEKPARSDAAALEMLSESVRSSLPMSEKPGDRIGPYKLLQQIGEGGCGIVYMAQQEEPIRRKVALKVIKLGMDTRNVIARFEAERQALALMDHPNIAKVLDAGATETGRPYFVMELVRGIKITDYCDQQRFSTPRRLELFIQVCQAVQHAHQKGIIHRDLKPSNILVTEQDGAPVPKVIDFGIAKATGEQRLTDKTVFTAFEQFIGTPAYMSPEQAGLGGLDVDTRSDIYSLGVLLYELLAGRPPFDSEQLRRSALDEILKTIRETEPPRPSNRLSTLTKLEMTTVAEQRRVEPDKLHGLLRGDLDWIVMKSLEKNRARRYETANGLASDIRRHLNTEPVLARPPSRLYEFQKTVRRHKFGFAATGALVVSLLIGLAISTWMFLQEKKAREQAVAAEQKARTEAAKRQQVAQFLKDMLQGVGPSVALGRDTTLLKEILDKTAERVGKDLTNQLEVEAELQNTIGEVYFNLGEGEKATAMYRKSLAIRRKIFGNETLQVAESLENLGWVMTSMGRQSEAEPLLRKALEICRNQLGNENGDVAEALNKLAYALYWEGRLEDAEPLYGEALGIARKLDDTNGVAEVLNNLALVLRDRGKRDEAATMLVESITIKRQVTGYDDPGIAMSLYNLAQVYHLAHKLPQAETTHREAFKLRQKILGDNHRDTLISLKELGLVICDEGRITEGAAMIRESLASQRKVLGDGHPDVANTAANLVDILFRQKKFDEAENLLNDILTPTFVAQPQSAACLRTRASVLARQGKWRAAADGMTQVVRFEPANPQNYYRLVLLLAAIGDLETYRNCCREIATRYAGTTDPQTGNLAAKSCSILPSSGVDLNVVRKWADTAVAGGTTHRFFAYFQCAKGQAEYRGGNFTNAVAWMQKTIDIGSHQGTYKWDDYLYVEAYAVSAMARQRLKQDDEARAALAKANEIAETKLPKLESGDIGSIWEDWIIAHKLLDEAKAMIEGGSTTNNAAK